MYFEMLKFVIEIIHNKKYILSLNRGSIFDDCHLPTEYEKTSYCISFCGFFGFA